MSVALAGDGVTPNDAADADNGPNSRQNFPTLTSAVASAGGTTVQGTLNSNPNTAFFIDFYASDQVDPSGHGEGQRYLGTVSTTTDNSGNVSFGGIFPSVAGQFISATATTNSPELSAAGTSEFSAPVIIASPGAFRFVSATYTTGEDANATITVERVGGSAGLVSVQYATSDGSAVQGSDYNATQGTLNFADGQSTATFSVSIVNDTADEPDETLSLTLTNPAGGATLGDPTNAVLSIVDDDLPPGPTPTPTATATPSPTPATRLGNIATRLRVETDDNVLIGGIIVTGSQPKRLIIRAIGPSSAVPGALQDPQLEIYRGDELIAANDNWREAPNEQEIIDSTVAPTNDLESAVLTTLEPGAYTAIVSGSADRPASARSRPTISI